MGKIDIVKYPGGVSKVRKEMYVVRPSIEFFIVKFVLVKVVWPKIKTVLN